MYLQISYSSTFLKKGEFFGKGLKIKSIIFSEFSANGGGVPPSVKIVNFFASKKNVQNALKHEKTKDIKMTSYQDADQTFSP